MIVRDEFGIDRRPLAAGAGHRLSWWGVRGRHARVGGVLTGGLGGRNVSIRTPKVRKAVVLPGLMWDHLLASLSSRVVFHDLVGWARIVSLPPGVSGWSSCVGVDVFCRLPGVILELTGTGWRV